MRSAPENIPKENDIGRSTLIIRVGAFVPDKNTGIRGTICVFAGPQRFPAEGWRDATAVLLAEWTKRFGRLLQGRSRRTQFDFMEGPYAIRVEAFPPDAVLTFFDRGSPRAEMVKAKVTVSLRELARALVEAALQTLDAARQAGWTGVDIERLEIGTAVVRHEVTCRILGGSDLTE
jgi:hypothetical protein